MNKTFSAIVQYMSAVAAIILTATTAFAQQAHDLQEVTVTARRQLSEIGVQRTSVDSTALKENISLSMADVIGFNSSVFVKSSGRATLATVSFRGAAASHTAVSWNGLPINSPALGMTDFSLIPAHFIDRASLLHGASSMTRSSGGLGGMVSLSTSEADIGDGVSLQYVQGAGSFDTFDEFLRIAYGSERWKFSTRAVYSSSRNDFKFINRDKKENIYDDNHNIIGQYHPTERNRNGAYRDLHLLQQIYFIPDSRNKVGLDIWYTGSNREIPLTTVDYIDNRSYENRQRENTLRAICSWELYRKPWRLALKGGYVHSWHAYDYDLGLPGEFINPLIDSRSHINTGYLSASFDLNVARDLYLNAAVNGVYNHVDNFDRATIGSGLGYNRGRADIDAAISARWQATERLGLSAIIREDVSGSEAVAPSPALFADYVVWQRAMLTLKGSVARNYHHPTLNDLYFLPGGNPDLKAERGLTYDLGAETAFRAEGADFTIAASWFDSHIDDWILWLPTNKGFFSPRNLKSVHSYGIEADATAALRLPAGVGLQLNGSYSWTVSVNDGEPLNPHDQSVGKQLPYVPRHAASAGLTLTWRSWSLLYKWQYYSRRYTMSSNESTLTGSLPRYFMSCATIEKRFALRRVDVSVKLAVNNIFDAEYQTIMSHPMPGANFEAFVSISY